MECRQSATLLGVLFVTLAGGIAARADEPRLSISGYDPVAYFTDGKPVQGKADFEYVVAQVALAVRQQ